MRSSQALDINCQGSIDMDEFLNLRKIVDDFRMDVTNSQLRALFYASDRDGDGTISFNEVRARRST